jgi:hypothetical protein
MVERGPDVSGGRFLASSQSAANASERATRAALSHGCV